MGGQFILMGMGMCVMPGRKSRLLLGLMRCLGMGMVHGMMLVFLTLPVFIRAVLGPGLGGLGIIRLAIGPVSWRHSQYYRFLLLKYSRKAATLNNLVLFFLILRLENNGGQFHPHIAS